MYKRFSLEEIATIKNKFVAHLAYMMQKEKVYDLKTFLKLSFKRGDDVYYFSRGNPVFHVAQKDNIYQFIDESDKIELLLPKDDINKLAYSVKQFMTRKNRDGNKKSITAILWNAFKDGQYMTIGDKPYLVYDIETSSNIWNLKETEFFLAYAMYPAEGNKMRYEYIAQDDLKKFVQKMLDFDGYIIWFNNIWFDNIVSAYSADFTEDEIAQLNTKSLDLFLFIRNMTGKRIGLNRVAQALVAIEKTLDVGASWDMLWRKYTEEWDMDALNEFKKYCKNDVKMTALVLLYMLHYKKMFIDNKEYTYTIEEFIRLASKQREKDRGPAVGKSMFKK